MKKLITPFIVAIIAVAGLWFPSISNGAQISTASQLQMLQSLLKQIQALQIQLNTQIAQERISGAPVVTSTLQTGENSSLNGTVTINELSRNHTASCILPTNLNIRSQGNSVYLLQKVLDKAGYYPEGLITGYYGNFTAAAVRRFKNANQNGDLNSLVKKYYPNECGDTLLIPPPSVSCLLSPSVTSGFVVETKVNFTFSALNPNNYNTYEMDFLGNGNFVNTSNSLASYTYQVPGIYYPQLRLNGSIICKTATPIRIQPLSSSASSSGI